MYGAKKKTKSPAKKYGSKSPAKKYGAKTPAMKKKSPAKRALVGKQKNLPENIKKAIKAAPTKKKTPMKMVKSMGNAGMVGKTGTAKKATAKKTTKKQGYNDRLDESLGMRRGKASSKKQGMKARRDESKGMAKKVGKKRAYGAVKTMDRKRG